MPERSTNTMPVSTARAGVGLRPACWRLRGARTGSSGWMSDHGSSSTSSPGRVTSLLRQNPVKVHGVLSSNDGEATLVWTLDGQGILMRSEWDATTYLQSGRPKQLLPDWSLPPADIYAVHPERLNLTAKVTAFVEFLEGFLGKGPGAG
jgi:DNA-binding transcriptional LysR family regulator